MSIIKEFKEFAIKGNVVDMAVGVIIGAAFGKVVSSLVEHILMPPLGYLVGGIDFNSFQLVIREGATAAELVAIKYGAFFQSIITFTIQAFAIFLVMKAMNTFKKNNTPPPAPPAGPSNEEKLLAEIRDLLKSGK
jgi:large conductance mechanosensitive channel